MNVLQNLINLYNVLPLDSTYRTVAKGILEHLDQMKDVTVYDIAEITNSSRTTVWRMAQKMGYKTFSDFRYALQTAASQYTYYNRILPCNICKTPEDIMNTVSGQMQKSVKLLKQNVTPKQLTEIADQLHRSEKIRFYMPFQLAFVEVLQQNLSFDSKDTAYFTLLPDMLEDVHSLDKNSILIISTIEFAETLDMHEVFKTAHNKGTSIWLAGNGSSQYKKYCDRLLLNVEADALSWLTALEGLFLSISEQYRFTYIDNSLN